METWGRLYTYSDVEKAAWVVLGVTDLPERHSAVRARIKHLRRDGMLESPGGGREAKYKFIEAFELICTLKLQDLGVIPAASAAATRMALRHLRKPGSRSPQRLLLINKFEPKIVLRPQFEELLARGELVSVIDFQLLTDSIYDALMKAIAMPRKKLGRPYAVAPDIPKNVDK